MATETPTADYTALLETLQKIQKHDFTILKLRASVSPLAPFDTNDLTQSSDASGAWDSSTPAALQADLSHYKELFSKLRFSYLEQVTKEKFLRAITEDPPLIVEPAENDALEAQLVIEKAALKESKASVDAILVELEALSQRLTATYSQLSGWSTAAATLPGETLALEARIDELEKGRQMPLDETVALLGEREAELARLEKELDAVERELPKRKKVLAELEGEIEPLELDKEGLERFASEAVRMRDSARAEGKAERESMGRWYRSVVEGLEALVPR
ncbi:hypothetical protein P167DRAFT_510818 [Morchella conica CCBAS932]|uniref:Kinetochore protein Sos7 coiled-coil domain-containing protein n=1 Tax=Morchella conica CCBAS932 TaxID=1392247 RepID=A0A3N4KM95_9PEZI|nr:hypothetical protein P167DRAFT_510818 [Morchella conica CCBAS932]